MVRWEVVPPYGSVLAAIPYANRDRESLGDYQGMPPPYYSADLLVRASYGY